MKKNYIFILTLVFAFFATNAQTTFTNATGPLTMDGTNCGANAFCNMDACSGSAATIDEFDIAIAGASGAAMVTQVCFELTGTAGQSTFDLSNVVLIAPDATQFSLFFGNCLGGTGLGLGCVLSDYVGPLCFETGGAAQPVTAPGTYEIEPTTGTFADIAAINPVNGNWSLAVVNNECFNGLPPSEFLNWNITIDETLSVEDQAIESVAVYPNPTTDFINIETKASNTVLGAELYSLSGQLVYKSESETKIDMSNFNSGVYLLKIATDNGTETMRIVKQ